MRAVVYARFGPPEVLELRELEPPAPRRGFARVRVRAAALNPKDVLVRKGRMRPYGAWGLPRTPGYDFAGELLDPVGELVEGQAVFGMLNGMAGATCAEQLLVPLDELAPKPEGLSFEQAAALPLAGLTALQALRDLLHVRAGQRVLINGASGGVGTLAVQLAAAMGAEVLASCSGRNAAQVQALGAARILDYTEGPSVFRELDCDAVFDVFGSLPAGPARVAMKPGALHCTTIPSGAHLARELLGRLGLSRARLVIVKSRRRDLEQLSRYVAEGRLRPVVDRVLPLAQSAEAHAYIETKRARGKVVLTL
ncbi:MAG: NAD(P)-dependent alcohol dehydrogenase [Alphaproteobacteria bacterium]|nr:NAD(P)-dependent alcohol dehydrogenase [Alphaproteobacteria bacterium]MCB9791238.1 NAD(P)-dependent alcohol dehydrogenase [Alphaproteobacteria bacterium]